MIARFRLALALLSAFLACGQGAAAQTADPPARVGRVARVEGTVSLRLGPDAAWQPATVNLPVTAGTGLRTEAGSAADLGIGGTHLAADERTALDVTRLDDAALDITATQGRLCLHPFTLPAGTEAVVQTPRGTARLSAAGRYEIVAGDTEHPTAITVLDGSAQVTGPAVNIRIGAMQTATIDGDGGGVPFRVALGTAVRSAFLDACLRRERPAAPNRPAVVAQMSGWEALDEYGSWTPTPQYGAVWFPRNDPAYVPYRAGHWTFVAPWGWTWVDDAPWGFAPSHYGRWVRVDNRWGWVAASPGLPPAGGPVYAPAVVGFPGGTPPGAPGNGQPTRWVPLGPREPYLPPYRVSATYVRNVNSTSIRNVSTVVQAYTRGASPAGPRSFMNAGAATTAASGPAAPAGQPVAPPPATPGHPPRVPVPAPAAAPVPAPGPAEAPRGARPVPRHPGGSPAPGRPILPHPAEPALPRDAPHVVTPAQAPPQPRLAPEPRREARPPEPRFQPSLPPRPQPGGFPAQAHEPGRTPHPPTSPHRGPGGREEPHR